MSASPDAEHAFVAQGQHAEPGQLLPAVQIELVVPPSGTVGLAGYQLVWLGKHYLGRTITVWADHRSVHVLLEGHHLKTVPSRLSDTHLQHLLMRGGQPAGPAPAAPAIPREGPLPPATAIEIDRTIDRYGGTTVGGQHLHLGTHLAGSRVTRDSTATSPTSSTTISWSRPCPHRSTTTGARSYAAYA